MHKQPKPSSHRFVPRGLLSVLALFGMATLSGCLPPGSTITLTVPPAPTTTAANDSQNNNGANGQFQRQPAPDSRGSTSQDGTSKSRDEPDVASADPSDPYSERDVGDQSDQQSVSGYEPDPDSSYSDSSYSDASYQDSTYSGNSYSDSSYQDESYSDSSYSDSSSSGGSYSDGSYQTDSSTDTGVSSAGSQNRANLPVRYGKQNLPASLIERMMKQ